MFTPQAGIFALGTSSHAYLEFDRREGREADEFASALAAIREPRTTTGSVNFVIGFRPELWRIMGRTKPDSVELQNKPVSSHVARTDQDEFGHIFRRNMPYGSVQDHGTVFVGFSAEQKRLARMLDSMAGFVNGTRDELTRFSQPFTGAYYFVPSVESLRDLR